ncbi:hypothetical protein ACFLRB_00295 [Acidobacteriota bacterium]
MRRLILIILIVLMTVSMFLKADTSLNQESHIDVYYSGDINDSTDGFVKHVRGK